MYGFGGQLVALLLFNTQNSHLGTCIPPPPQKEGLYNIS